MSFVLRDIPWPYASTIMPHSLSLLDPARCAPAATDFRPGHFGQVSMASPTPVPSLPLGHPNLSLSHFAFS